MTLRFEGRVAIVTGAGNGLGRCHAFALAERGARVVVNDIGGAGNGTGSDASVAECVAADIRAAGGDAVANTDPVQQGERIVEQAMDIYGRVDVLINNAGILRDAAFHKMTDEQWQAIYEIHLLGSYRTTRAAWEPMRAASYGRIVMTSSAAGLYGNFGQANYAAAKLGMIGLGNTLAVEGRSRGITVNTIAPVAASRLTAGVMPPAVLERLQPDYVTPLVLLLAHETHGETGGIFEVGGGWISAVRWEQSEGATFDLDAISPEAIGDRWAAITSFRDPRHRTSVMETMTEIGERIGVPFALGVQ
jgi:3-hydroxyacyl-CoA dehydrogenase/3a,7a,12a-trihydroxy-5b-cholest-24-enoyl-CoA hydratase